MSWLLLVVVLVLLVINIRNDIKSFFTIAVNSIILLFCGGLEFLMAFIPYCFNTISGTSSYSMIYQSDYIIRIMSISCIFCILMLSLKFKLKMRKKIILFIISSLITLGFVLLAIPVMFNKQGVFTDLCSLSEYIRHCVIFVAPLLLQTNLFIYFINANRDCFKKN